MLIRHYLHPGGRKHGERWSNFSESHLCLYVLMLKHLSAPPPHDCNQTSTPANMHDCLLLVLLISLVSECPFVFAAELFANLESRVWPTQPLCLSCFSCCRRSCSKPHLQSLYGHAHFLNDGTDCLCFHRLASGHNSKQSWLLLWTSSK